MVKRQTKLTGPAHPRLVLVVWDDAYTKGVEGVTPAEVAASHRPSVFQTVGWILKEDEEGLSVANERCLDVGDEYYRGYTFVPRGLLKSVTPLNVARPRRKKALGEKAPAGSAAGTAGIRADPD